MTTVRKNIVPNGFTDNHDSKIWNVGHVFTWAAALDCWLNLNHKITVKPGETTDDAYQRREYDKPLSNYHVFFVRSFV